MSYLNYIIPVPGKGIECGNSECSRYADCHISLDSSVELRKAQCFCLTGFKGNGQTCQRLRPHEGNVKLPVAYPKFFRWGCLTKKAKTYNFYLTQCFFVIAILTIELYF